MDQHVPHMRQTRIAGPEVIHALRGQPFERAGKQQNAHHAQPEGRHGVKQIRDAGKTPIQQSAMVFARVQAQPATQNHRQDGACAGEQQRVPKPLCNEYSHRLRIGKGITQVSMKQIDDVFPQLHMKRLIQAKLNGQRLNHILRNRIGSGQDSHGITRSQLDNQKV